MTKASTPPYPRLGEFYRVIAAAMDTKRSDRDLDRLAREGDYDWSLLPSLRKKIVIDPMTEATDAEFAEVIGQFIDHLHASYLRLVANIPADSLSRAEMLPLLVEYYFAPQGIALLRGLRDFFGGPDLLALLDDDRHPIQVVLDWIDGRDGRQILKEAFPESTGSDRSDRELISRWMTGTQLPDHQNIKRIAKLMSSSAIVGDKALHLRRWLIVARSLSWLSKQSELPIKAYLRQHLLNGTAEIDMGKIISLANIGAGRRLSALVTPALLLYERLKRTTIKQPGAQAEIKRDLDTFERLCAEHDPEGLTRFHFAWLLGRWHVLSGRHNEALQHYAEAAELAAYRAGNQQKQIFEETLVLAAVVGSSTPLLKRLKNQAIAFELFNAPRSNTVLEGWEVDHLRQQFHRIFPKVGWFSEAQIDDLTEETLPFLWIEESEFARIKPDLATPDRVRSIKTVDGQKRRWPQLRLFASIGRHEEVKDLLERGASVDQLDDSGGSALLCAIQHADASGDRRALDLLLERTHEQQTLDNVTLRKRHTPLICAVRYGEPDVVERILQMGAKADVRGQIEESTPLYRCIESIGALTRPMKSLNHLSRLQRSAPDQMQREVLRRHDIRLGGTFGDEHTLRTSISHPAYQAAFENTTTSTFVEAVGHLSEPKLLKILQLLLESGANPNAVHNYPVPGRTPLMLAAENDSTGAFELLLQKGGDPYLRDSHGANSIQIANYFGSGRVVSFMRSKRIV